MMYERHSNDLMKFHHNKDENIGLFLRFSLTYRKQISLMKVFLKKFTLHVNPMWNHAGIETV